MFRILVVRSRRKVRWADYLLLRRKAVLGRARGNVGCAGWVRGDEGFGPFGRVRSEEEEMSPCKSGRNRCLRCFFVEMKDLDLEDRTFAGNAVNQVMEILRCYSDESDLHGYYFYSEVKCPEVRLFFFHILVALEIFAPLYILLCDSFSLLQMHPDGSRIAHWLLQQLLLRRRSLDQSQPALRADIAMIAHQSMCPTLHSFNPPSRMSITALR
jgi:hypothetical protein